MLPKLMLVAPAANVPLFPVLFLPLELAFVRPTQLERPTIARVIARVKSAAKGLRVEVEEVEWLPRSAEIAAKLV